MSRGGGGGRVQLSPGEGGLVGVLVLVPEGVDDDGHDEVEDHGDADDVVDDEERAGPTGSRDVDELVHDDVPFFWLVGV